MERIQYVREMAVEQLKEFRQMILVGAQAPIGYFAQPGKDSVFTSQECEICTLASPGEDYVGALEAVESALVAASRTRRLLRRSRAASLPSGSITLQGLAAVVGALLPENMHRGG